MADEMQKPVENTPVESQIPAPSAPEVSEPKPGSKNMLVIFSGVLIFALILLAAGGFVYLNSKNSNVSYNPNSQTEQTPVATQSISPTPLTSVNSSSELDSAFNEVSSTGDKDLQNDLNQANSEGQNL